MEVTTLPLAIETIFKMIMISTSAGREVTYISIAKILIDTHGREVARHHLSRLIECGYLQVGASEDATYPVLLLGEKQFDLDQWMKDEMSGGSTRFDRKECVVADEPKYYCANLDESPKMDEGVDEDEEREYKFVPDMVGPSRGRRVPGGTMPE